ncbi:MAG: hypothetical protein IT382_15470 [Deltaproteobacteria bacterium]|nr:hypothetical protein [Deltaproteobacteria bacterium]
MRLIHLAIACSAPLWTHCACEVPLLACADDRDCGGGLRCLAEVCAAADALDAGDSLQGDEGEGEGPSEGEGELPSAASCREILVAEPAAPSGRYSLQIAQDVVEVECDMVTSGGGWTLLWRFVEGEACPGTMETAPRGCGRGDLDIASATLAPLHPFTEVRGTVRALGAGGSDAFRDQAPSASERYLDGVALTVGTPRRHLFAFAHGLSDGFGTDSPASECPCAGGTSPPTFVGGAYLCEAPRASVLPDGTRLYDNDDVLFDGLLIDDPGCVGAPESAPEFQVALGASSDEALELHVMQSQAPSDEDLAIVAVELWVR